MAERCRQSLEARPHPTFTIWTGIALAGRGALEGLAIKKGLSQLYQPRALSSETLNPNIAAWLRNVGSFFGFFIGPNN